MRHNSVSSSRGSHWAPVREFSDEPESDSETRDSFDVDSERESQVGDVDAEREAHAIEVLQERMSEILTQSLDRYPPSRRRGTDPAPKYSRFQREEIHIEPLTATRLSFPTSERFEHGVRLNRRATYTPSFTTTQFHSSMSIHGAANGQRRASLAGRPTIEDYQRDKKLELHRPKEPESEPTMNSQRWSLAAPPSSIQSRYQRSPAEKSQDAERDVPPAKTSRRRRLSAAVKSWFK